MLTFSASGAVGLMVFSGLWETQDLTCSEMGKSSGFSRGRGSQVSSKLDNPSEPSCPQEAKTNFVGPHPPPLAAPPSRRRCLESPLLSQAEGAKESITSWKGTMLTRTVSVCFLFQQI